MIVFTCPVCSSTLFAQAFLDGRPGAPGAKFEMSVYCGCGAMVQVSAQAVVRVEVGARKEPPTLA